MGGAPRAVWKVHGVKKGSAHSTNMRRVTSIQVPHPTSKRSCTIQWKTASRKNPTTSVSRAWKAALRHTHTAKWILVGATETARRSPKKPAALCVKTSEIRLSRSIEKLIRVTSLGRTANQAPTQRDDEQRTTRAAGKLSDPDPSAYSGMEI